MADEEQVARLKRGVEEWNQWREQNFVQSYDLSGANLSYIDLSGANLSGANLSCSDLSGANLSCSDLSGANLSRADLLRADLIRTNLSGANLNGANLSRANLNGVNLSGANLSGANLSIADLSYASILRADLSYASLSGADLIRTNLSRANLSRANLNEANLSYANLNGADLLRADLSGANLFRTKLSGADLTKSRFDHTLFVEVDLSTVQGLETAEHQGPSTININLVILPHDESTRTRFLGGVGFTEEQINYLPSLLTPRPIQYHSLFISYTRQDEALAQRLSTDLSKRNVPCWFAPHDLHPGNYFRKHIDQAIHTQDKVLLLLSEHSVKSGWVEHEVEVALRREISQKREILFPVRLDGAIFSCTATWAISLKDMRHIGDFTGWQDEQRYQEAFVLLLRHLKTEPSSPYTLS